MDTASRIETPALAPWRRVPTALLLASGGLVAVTLLVVFVIDVIGPLRDPGQADGIGDPFTATSSAMDLNLEQSNSGEASRAAAVAREAGRLDAIEERLGNLGGAIEQTRRDMGSHQSDTAQTLTSQVARLDALEGSLEHRAEALRSHDGRLGEAEQRLDALAPRLEELEIARRKRPTTRTSRPNAQPPFTVEVVDQWGGVPYVVVSKDGETAFLREGEIRAGWRLMRIDANARSVRLRGPGGEDRTDVIAEP